MRRIGVLLSLSDSDPEGRLRVEAFRQALENHGWTEGRNIQIEYRRTGSSPERARTYAAELVAMDLEVIFAAPTFRGGSLATRNSHCAGCIRAG